MTSEPRLKIIIQRAHDHVENSVDDHAEYYVEFPDGEMQVMNIPVPAGNNLLYENCVAFEFAVAEWRRRINDNKISLKNISSE